MFVFFLFIWFYWVTCVRDLLTYFNGRIKCFSLQQRQGFGYLWYLKGRGFTQPWLIWLIWWCQNQWNQRMWKKMMDAHLCGLNKMRYVNGTFEAPTEEDEDYLKWENVIGAVMSVLYKSMTKDVLELIIGSDVTRLLSPKRPILEWVWFWTESWVILQEF